jgi:hypothetical protein
VIEENIRGIVSLGALSRSRLLLANRLGRSKFGLRKINEFGNPIYPISRQIPQKSPILGACDGVDGARTGIRLD